MDQITAASDDFAKGLASFKTTDSLKVLKLS